MKKILSMAFSLLSLFSCRAQDNLSVDAFQKMLQEDGSAQLVDVRTPQEFAEGHICGAVNIDWFGSDFLEKAKASLDPGRPVMLYCRSGRRSASAAAKLAHSGFKTYNMLGGILEWTASGKAVTTFETERFLTDSGAPLEITLIKHASLAISWKGKSIQVDPVTACGKHTDYANEFPKADIILITHEHFDHLDKDAVTALKKDGTRIVANGRSVEILGEGEALSNGQSVTIDGIRIDAVPAYNTTDGHLQFHPKGRDNGYVLTVDGLRIYIAGDTEDIPEMSLLKDIDIAFLPVNQPYTMTPQQCIRAASILSPKVLIPYHFSQTDLSSLPGALKNIDVRLRSMQ